MCGGRGEMKGCRPVSCVQQVAVADEEDLHCLVGEAELDAVADVCDAGYAEVVGVALLHGSDVVEEDFLLEVGLQQGEKLLLWGASDFACGGT